MNIAKMAIEQRDISIYDEVRIWMKRYEKEYKETNSRYPKRIEEFENIINSELIV